MPGIDKAVILAAGTGTRIASVSGGAPKPLLPLDGRAGGLTFLDWHLLMLDHVGCRDIYLVGNARTYGVRLASMDIVPATWILNPADDPEHSGSAHSAHLAWTSPHRILDGTSRVVLMDADVIYEPSVLELLVACPPGRSKTLVCSRHAGTGEEVLVFADADDPSRPRLHGKGLAGTPLVEGLVCLGEATGIVLWEPEAHELVGAASDWVTSRSAAGARSEHEDVTQLLMARGAMEAVVFDDQTFMECDTPSDYAVLCAEVFPLLANHAGRERKRR
jgi:choline kinase